MRRDLNAVEVDDKVFRARRVRELLKTLDYLKDSGTLHPFSSNFFQNFILDMIFVNNLELWQYVDSETDNLDILFALGATAIATALKDFQEGYNMPLDVSCASANLQLPFSDFSDFSLVQKYRSTRSSTIEPLRKVNLHKEKLKSHKSVKASL